MQMLDIIEKKRDKHALTDDEICFFIEGFVSGSIPDYQASALLMAIMFNGLNSDETFFLTRSMLNSGNINSFNDGCIYADKHSTGGVSDSTSIIIAPIVSLFGIKTAKMSGFGLGHTGGTLDKLQSIKGYDIALSFDRFKSIVDSVGCSIIGQTENIVPADKKLYALRDVTATVDNIGLIASSIMSKKLSVGSDIIVLDVKAGNGAFMQSIDNAILLAQTMVDIGTRFGKNVTALVTDMNQPLGDSVGCSLEVIEGVQILKGEKRNNLSELALILSATILYKAKVFKSVEDAYSECEKTLHNGSAFERFVAMVRAHGGDAECLYNTDAFPLAKNTVDIIAKADGVISNIDTKGIGKFVCSLGGGRITKADIVDHGVGLILYKKLNNVVKKGDKIAKVYYNSDISKIIGNLENCFQLSQHKAQGCNLIYKTI